jgi:hypothetical protein
MTVSAVRRFFNVAGFLVACQCGCSGDRSIQRISSCRRHGDCASGSVLARGYSIVHAWVQARFAADCIAAIPNEEGEKSTYRFQKGELEVMSFQGHKTQYGFYEILVLWDKEANRRRR